MAPSLSVARPDANNPIRNQSERHLSRHVREMPMGRLETGLLPRPTILTTTQQKLLGGSFLEADDDKEF